MNQDADMRTVTEEACESIDARSDAERDELLSDLLETAYPTLTGQSQ